MSDLAPFVAAAIRDKVIEDLQKENAKLTQQAKDRKADFEAFRTISIVDSSSKSKKQTAVVYSKNNMSSMETTLINRAELAITLFSRTHCKVSMLQQVRLHVGDCCVPWQLDRCTVRMQDEFHT